MKRPILLFLLFSLVLGVPRPLTAKEPELDDFPAVTLWPLVWHRATPEESTTDVLWPFFQQKSKGEWHRVALRPFLYSKESDPSRDFRRMHILWPVSLFHREGETERNYIFPAYWRGRDEQREWLHLWPLYGNSLQADGTRTRSTLYPFFRYSSNEQTGDWSWDAPWPLVNFFHRQDAEGGRLLPFYWRHRAEDTDGGMLFPYLWYETEETAHQAILPLWYRRRTPQSSTTMLLPLYWQHRAENTEGGMLFPYLWYEKEEAKHQAILPLWFRRRTPQSSTNFLLPLWFSHQGQNRRYQGLLPLYWQQQEKDTRLRLIAPLHLHHIGTDAETSLWLPVYFHHQDRLAQSELVYYFPFYGKYTLRDQVTRHLVLFPLYAHFVDLEREHQSWNVLWPLFHYETAPESYQAWALPFYWRSRAPAVERTMAFGLYWSFRREDSGTTLLVPVYGHFATAEREQRHIPLLYSTFRRADGYHKSLFLGPIYIDTEDPRHERRQSDFLWPLVSWKDEGEKHHRRALPFYWHERRPGRELSLGSVALLPPYYLRQETAERSLLHLWPLFGKSRLDSYQEVSSFWPLLRWGDDTEGQRRTRQFLLAYSLTEGDVQRTGFFPLWHRRQEPGKKKDLSLLHWSEEDKSKGSSRFAVLHLGDPEYSLFGRSSDEKASRHHLFPLYSFRRDDSAQTRQLSILGPFLSRQSGPDHSRTRLLWKTLYFEHGPDREESGLLWRLVRSYRAADQEIFEFNPFYYRERKKDGGEEYRAWLGGIYAVRQRPEQVRRRLLWLVKW
jgi:hypothetical protein